jgi:branched-chain amino acid transport system substrate-binding protein
MTRRSSIVFLVATLILAFAATTHAQKPVKIGVLTPLSPPGDPGAGQLILRGAKMAAEEINAKGGLLGGRKVELVIEDDSGTPEKGVAGFRKLASQDQVAGVMGQFHSSVMLATQELAEQFKIPIFATQASARSITEKHLNYTFRTHVIDPDRVTVWNRWIMERGFKRVFLLAENTDYGTGLVEETKRLFKTMGVRAELDTAIFDRTSVDLTPQLLKIKAWKPDVVLNGAVGTPIYLMIKQAYDVGLFPAVPMLVSYDAPVRPEFWKTVGDKGAYVTFITYYHPLMKLPPRGEGFRKKYVAEFKEDPVYSAFNGYTQVMLIADAVAAAKSDRGEDIVKALLAGKFEGWNGTIGFTRGEGPHWQQWTPPMLIVQYTRAEQPYPEVKISFPPEFKNGDWMAAPAR